MKIPAPPPPLSELLARVEAAGRFGAVAHAALRLDTASTYLPWDKLRFKTPPEGLSHEEWWCALKISRNAVRRSIPELRRIDGTPFHYTLPDDVLRGAERVTRDASGTITFDERVANESTRDRYLVTSLIEEAITSSQLEGAATSRRDAKEMIRSGRAPRDVSERMILNNYRAMERIVELRDEPLTPQLVTEIHRIVTDGTLTDPASAGRIQADDATRIAIWGDEDQLLHRPPAAAELPTRLEALCAFANARESAAYMPAVLRSITLHFMMGYDHYFEDGNGRTARAVFYWSMLSQGYWLTEFLTISRILKEDPAKYARSFLLTEDDDGDLTHFFIHHLDVLQRAIKDLHTYLARKSDEIRSTRARFATDSAFNDRQVALLERALTDPSTVFTAISHSSSHRVTSETARQDLLALEHRGLLVRLRGGRQHRWSAPPNLSDRLAT